MKLKTIWIYLVGLLLIIGQSYALGNTFVLETSDGQISFNTTIIEGSYINCSDIIFDNGNGSSAICDGTDDGGAGGSQWPITEYYLYNNSGTLDFNETLLNATIDTRSVSAGDTNASTACSGSTTYLDGEGNCDDISVTYVQASDWTTIDNYPSGCGANEYVTTIGDTLTCINVVNDTDTNTNANTECSGTDTYYDGEGNCDDISGTYVQANDWTTIDNYPSGCGANEYITTIGDTLTCINVVNDTDTDTWNTTTEMFNAVNDSAFDLYNLDCDKINFSGVIGSASICDGDDASAAGGYDLNVSGDAGSGAIGDAEVFTIFGNNGVNTSMSGNTLTITVSGYVPTASLVDWVGNWTADKGSLVTWLGNWSLDQSNYFNITTSSSSYVNRSDWLTIDNYPSGCGANEYVTSVGDTLTCINVVNDTDTTYTAGEQLNLAGTVFSHNDSSSQASSDNSGRTYIQDIILDSFGHITSIVTETETVTDTDTDTNASTACSGTSTYLDGEGNCDDISGTYVQANDWTTIDDYPTGCGANEYITTIGDTLTCINVVNDTDTDTWNTTAEMREAVNASLVYDFTSSDVECTDCIGTTEITDSYLLNTGDTGSGNYIFQDNITVENIFMEVDSTNHRIYDNTTCTIITGDTSTLSIC